MNPDDHFVLNLCPTGIVPTRERSAAAPLTPDEVARDLRACLPHGLSSVHLHARDEHLRNSNEPAVYARFIEAVRECSDDLVLCVSLSGRIDPTLDGRAAVLALDGDLRPDMGSLTLGSMNFTRDASLNAPDTIAGLAVRMQERGIKPELEVFDLGMVNCAHYLISRGYLEPPYLFNILLGNPFTAQADPLHLGAILKELPEDSLWAAGGIGRYQTPALAMALAAGGGVRVGLEDNLWFDRQREVPATNAALVARAAEIGRLLDRTPYTPAALRERLKLPRRN